MQPTPYAELNAVLRTLTGRVQAALGDTFTGLYLQGSFAVGDFDEHSDVDFIAALAEPLSEGQVAALQELHGAVYDIDNPWAKHLEGSYFPPDVLRDYTRTGEAVWYLDHGSRELIRSTHCNMALVRWVVREWGVPLAGPDPASLVDPIPVAALRREILHDMRNWGQEILGNTDHFNNRFYQGFITLSYCRMLHDLQRGCPGSKRTGAAWAKATLDPRWAGLIDRAWDTRPDPAAQVRQRADPADFAATLDFVRYVIGLADEYAASSGVE